MKIESMQVSIVKTNKQGVKQQLSVCINDQSTHANRWAMREMMRCINHNCKWPDLHRLGKVFVKLTYPKPSKYWD